MDQPLNDSMFSDLDDRLKILTDSSDSELNSKDQNIIGGFSLMRKIILTLTLCLLMAGASFAAIVQVDSFEDTTYTTVLTEPAEVLTLTNSVDSTEGSNSLEVSYTPTVQGQWYKNTQIRKALATPIDISTLEYFHYDINVPVSSSVLILVTSFIDDKGIEARFLDYDAFSSVTTGFETHSFAISSLQKSKWVTGGKAANLSKISEVVYRIMNEFGATTADTYTFKLDNANFDNATGLLNEVVIEDFEAFADDSSLQATWGAAWSRPCNRTLETSNPYNGTQALNMDVDMTGVYVRYGAEYTFSSTQDFSAARYFKMNLFGNATLAGYNPTIELTLVDSAGNRVIGFIWDWGVEAEWMEIFLPFQTDGVAGFADAAWTYEWLYASGSSCWREDRWDGSTWDDDTDLDSIDKIIISIEAQAGTTFPLNGLSILIDDITVGYAADAIPVPSVQNYMVNEIPTGGTAPTIDGTIGAGEWDIAEAPGCTGYVHHDNNALAATEDPEVKVMYDDTNLYILTQVTTADFSQDFSPNPAGDDVSSAGDKFPMFFIPSGNQGDAFYRISLVPNPGDGNLYLWDEAALTIGFPGVASWTAANDAGAFSYDAGSDLLVMEYSIPWTDFDFTGNVLTGAPANGAEWGIQLGYSNENLGAGEWINWEPDTIPGYISGKPFGIWMFMAEGSDVDSWDLSE
jgi:hypothetical protein